MPRFTDFKKEFIEKPEMIEHFKQQGHKTQMINKVVSILKEESAPGTFNKDNMDYPLKRLQELRKQGKITQEMLDEASQPLLPWMMMESMKDWEYNEIIRNNIRSLYHSLKCYAGYHMNVLDVMGCKNPADPRCVRDFLDTIYDAGDKCIDYYYENQEYLDILRGAMNLANAIPGSYRFLTQPRQGLDDKSIISLLVPNTYSPIPRKKRIVAFSKAISKHCRLQMERRIFLDNMDKDEEE